MLKLMYITNKPEIAKVAENAGVDRIFVDMEYIGKSERQGGMDTVQSHHTAKDVAMIRKVVSSAEVLVRINPIHEATVLYESSKDEIDTVIEAGADILMLPYFKTVQEVRDFIRYVAGRVKTMLLVETPESVEIIDDILELPGINYIHIGLNDLSLGYKKKFMFELLVDGTVEQLCQKFGQKGISYGFGGIATLGTGALPAEYIIREHYRLGSTCAILSRSFCDTSKIEEIDTIRSIFENGLQEIRDFEKQCQESEQDFEANRCVVEKRVNLICSRL